MQHAAPAHPPMSPSRYLLVYLFVCFCSLAFVRPSMRSSLVQLRQQRRRPAAEPEIGAEAEKGAEKGAEIAAETVASKRFCRYPVCDRSSSVF